MVAEMVADRAPAVWAGAAWPSLRKKPEIVTRQGVVGRERGRQADITSLASDQKPPQPGCTSVVCGFGGEFVPGAGVWVARSEAVAQFTFMFLAPGTMPGPGRAPASEC